MKKVQPKLTQARLFHPVSPYTRNAYLVESSTRTEVSHLVDLEGYEKEKVVCTCEAFIYGGARPCPHIKSVKMQV